MSFPTPNDLSDRNRPPFMHRPWIRGFLYDTLSSDLVLHSDAFAFALSGRMYLVVDFRTGGKDRVAADGWLIETDGLVPLNYDLLGEVFRAGSPMLWDARNNATMGPGHKHVHNWNDHMMALGQGRWTQLSARMHYVRVEGDNCEPYPNKWTPRKDYAPRKGKIPDMLSAPKKRGRPRTKLPNWL